MSSHHFCRDTFTERLNGLDVISNPYDCLFSTFFVTSGVSRRTCPGARVLTHSAHDRSFDPPPLVFSRAAWSSSPPHTHIGGPMLSMAATVTPLEGKLGRALAVVVVCLSLGSCNDGAWSTSAGRSFAPTPVILGSAAESAGSSADLLAISPFPSAPLPSVASKASSASTAAGGGHLLLMPFHRRQFFAHDDSIFVGIASFRDPQCPITIREMFKKATNPNRVFIGTIEQNTDEEPACIPVEYDTCDPFSFCPRDNIRIRRWPPKISLGPTFGRYVSVLMYRAEKYYMMIDSHNRFIFQWDYVVLKMYIETPGQKKVLSNYPQGFDGPEERVDKRSLQYLCKQHWIPEFHYSRNKADVVTVNGYTRPTPYTAAGFLWADAEILELVPFDPHLDYLFDGEELLFSVRLWTYGYDIWCPSENILFHDYNRHTAKRFWHEKVDWGPIQAVSRMRVQRMLKSVFKDTKKRVVPDDMKVPERVLREYDKYDLGKVRTLEEYWKFAMVDTVKHTDGEDFCKTFRMG